MNPVLFLSLIFFSVLALGTSIEVVNDDVNVPTPPTPSEKSTEHFPLCEENFLSMSQTQLFHAATEGRQVGGCFIAFGGPRNSCDLYVKTATRDSPHGKRHYRGWPQRSDGRGVGCVKAPDFPKRMSHCFYNTPLYDLTPAERGSFCTKSGEKNAVMQLLHAIKHRQCNLKSCSPSQAPTPTPTPTLSPECKNYYLSLPDSDLYHAATEGRSVGGCFIWFGNPVAACDLYVKTATLGALQGTRHYFGWPRQTDGRGTGCVKAPDFPKQVTYCYYNTPLYDLTPSELASFCTNSGKDNSVAQLRHAIEHDQCDITSC